MANIIGIRGEASPAAGIADPEVVEYIEACLARAKTGETLAIAFIEVLAGNTTAIAYVNKHNYHHLLAGASRLVHRLSAEPDDA